MTSFSTGIFQESGQIISGRVFRRAEDRESGSAGFDARFLGDFFQGSQQFRGLVRQFAALHLFTGRADQGVNQSRARTFLRTRMMGRNHDRDTGTLASGQEFHGMAVQDSGGGG